MTTISHKLDLSGWDVYEDLMPRAIQETHLEALEDAAQIMVDTVAVDTGETQGSITVNPDTMAVEVGGAALFLEFGTVHMDPQPFMIPAFHQITDELDRRLADKVKQVGLG